MNKMDWMINFIIPVAEIVFVGFIICFISYILAKAFYKFYKRNLKFIIRYDILRNKYKDKDVAWLSGCFARRYNIIKVEMILLTDKSNIPEERVYELLWIYKKIIKQLKGGKEENGQYFKGDDSKGEANTSLPSNA